MFTNERIQVILEEQIASWDQCQIVRPQLLQMPEAQLGSTYTATRPAIIWTLDGLPLRYAQAVAADARFYQLKPNEIFYFNCGDWMQRDSTRSYCLMKIEWHPDVSLITINHNQKKYYFERSAINPRLQGHFTEPPANNNLIDHLRIKSLIGLCLSDMQIQKQSISSKAHLRFLSCCDHLREHLSENPSRDHIAQAIGIHPGHVSRLFQQFHTGGYDSYLRHIRTERAQQLLRESTLSVEQIAHACGVSNVSWFIRCFKQETGLTPGQFKKTSYTNESV